MSQATTHLAVPGFRRSAFLPRFQRGYRPRQLLQRRSPWQVTFLSPIVRKGRDSYGCSRWSTFAELWKDPPFPIGSMYAIYGNIYHQYIPNVSIYTSTMDPMGFEWVNQGQSTISMAVKIHHAFFMAKSRVNPRFFYGHQWVNEQNWTSWDLNRSKMGHGFHSKLFVRLLEGKSPIPVIGLRMKSAGNHGFYGENCPLNQSIDSCVREPPVRYLRGVKHSSTQRLAMDFVRRKKRRQKVKSMTHRDAAGEAWNIYPMTDPNGAGIPSGKLTCWPWQSSGLED